MGRKLTDSEVKHWRGRMELSKAIIAERAKQWRKNIDRYANRLLPRPTEGSPLEDFVSVDMLFSNIGVKKPSLIFQNPDVMAIPKNQDVSDAQRLLAEGTIRHYIHEWRLKRRIASIVLDTLLMGYGCSKVGYSTRTVEDTEPADRKGQKTDSLLEKVRGILPRGKRSEEVKETSVDPVPPKIANEGPVVFRVSPMNLLTHPDATFPLDENARWVCHRTVQSKLQALYDDRFPSSWRRNLKPSRFIDTSFYPNLPKDFDPRKVEDPDMQFVEFYEIWDMMTRETYVFADNNWDAGAGRVFDWPFEGMEGFPFEILLYHEIPDEQIGLSEVDPIINQLEELDKIRTFQIRHMKKVSGRMYLKTTNFLEGTDDKIRRGKDGTVLTVDAESVEGQMKLLEDARISADVFGAQSDVKEDLTNISAVAEFDRGRVAGSQTATEAAIIEGANRLRADFAQGQTQDFVLETLKKSFQIMQQWLPENLAIKISGPTIGTQWKNVTAEDIAGEFDLRIVPGSTAPPNREVLRSQALRMYELLMQNPIVDQRELVLLLTNNFPELMAGGREDRLVKNPQAAMEALQELQANGGGGLPEQGLPEGLPPELNLPVG